MAKERTKKSSYASRYSPDGYVTAAQLITEICCEKKAWSEKKELPLKFWELEEWAKFYRNQIASANKLLKKYAAEAILQALRDKRTKTTYSLRANWLIPIIEEYQKKVDLAASKPKVDRKVADTTIVPKQHVKKNILDKLKELE